ncbi:TlpA family protein disulfide reductase [Flavobacterium algicola]|uniref:TlpA family protein disulfide reductase n=1 Tax=Flavobacterium algicola TaxID=556529 RepID=UPI001EFD8899|nr:TlpA disulfide reductase family protein [Flavobacterium algicola]MCG9793617.1 TlpA family protein disulfide reductase [Flavobacterium algicola]
MKKATSLFILLFVFMACSKANEEKTSFNEEALNETLMTRDGNQVSFESILKENQGKTTVIEIWASWCGDCIGAMPKLKELQANHPDVNYVFISMDKSDTAWQNGIEKHELKGAHYMANDQMKGKFANAVDVDWIPRYIIIDKTGKIALYRAIETDFDKIDKTITELK